MEYRIIIDQTFKTQEEYMEAIMDIAEDIQDGVTSGEKPKWRVQEITAPMTASNLLVLDDESILTFGTHKDKKLKDVPDSWLMWWYDENRRREFHAPYYKALFKYCEDNIDAFRKNTKKQ